MYISEKRFKAKQLSSHKPQKPLGSYLCWFILYCYIFVLYLMLLSLKKRRFFDLKLHYLQIHCFFLDTLDDWFRQGEIFLLAKSIRGSINKTSTAKQVLGNCERMVFANLVGNRLSTFILWIWMSTCKFYFCTVVLCYQTY